MKNKSCYYQTKKNKKFPMTGVEPGLVQQNVIKQKEWSRDQPSRCITPRGTMRIQCH